MRRGFSLAIAGLLSLGASLAFGQQAATTVQLPTFSFFTVSTTVSVPDSGGAYLGGVNRAASGRTTFGPPIGPKQSAIGLHRQTMGMHVTAQVIDLNELDRQVLGQAGPLPLPPPEARLARQLHLAGKSTAGHRARSIASIQQEKAGQATAQQQTAWRYFQKGQAAEVAGKTNVAKLYYKMASRRASGSLRQQVLDRIDALSTPRPRLATQPRR